MAAALISALSNRPLKHELAMTGEITLRGRILPIGGLKEKLMAAHRMHLKTVFIPKRNGKDLIEVPRNVKRDLEIVLTERMGEILDRVLQPASPERVAPPDVAPRSEEEGSDDNAETPVDSPLAAHTPEEDRPVATPVS